MPGRSRQAYRGDKRRKEEARKKRQEEKRARRQARTATGEKGPPIEAVRPEDQGLPPLEPPETPQA